MEASFLHASASPSRSNRAGRFKASKSARKEVRRAVALAEELGLHSVAVRGAVWTLKHDLTQPRRSSSGQRTRATEAAAGAAEHAAAGRMGVPEREPRPRNRRQRRSQARMADFNHACELARREVAPSPAPAASFVDDAVSSTPADEPTAEVDEQRAMERSPERAACSSAVDESSAALASCLAADSASTGEFPCSPSGRPTTQESEPEEVAARHAARRLFEACESAAADAAQRSTPRNKRRKKRGSRARVAPALDLV